MESAGDWFTAIWATIIIAAAARATILRRLYQQFSSVKFKSAFYS